MANQELHVVLGAGQVGPRVAQLLADRGHRVRIARRTSAPSRVTGIETISVDVRDADAVARASDGAAVVYNCVNPLYTEWSEKLLPMIRGISEGTRRSGARLVALDNLYMYGDTSHLTETSKVAPVSKKGQLRAEAGEILLAAGAAIGRAADFIGPDTPLTLFGDRFFSRVFAGKSAELFGNPELVHSYSYTPDVARGLVALGSRSDTRGVWMLPVQPAESTRNVVGRIEAALGRKIATSTVPTWLLRTFGVFNPMLREVAEMAYQWEQPYHVDDSKFRRAFGIEPTGWNEIIASTVAWANATYGAAQAA